MKGECSVCGEFSDLAKGNKSTKTGEQLYRSYCNLCQAERKHKHYEENKEKCNAASTAWNRDNKEKRKEIKKKWADKNPDYMQVYQKTNRSKFNSYGAKRRAAKKHATTGWSNEFFLEEAYRLANLRTQVTGLEWHVDHIVPLQHKDACGLHTEDNLQVIPAALNYKKMNYTMDQYRWSDCFGN